MGKRADLKGQKFGRLIALEPTDTIYRSSYLWKCICDCGKEVLVSVENLRGGNTKSCGCLKHKEPINIVGNRYGRLVVLRESTEHEHSRYTYWVCKCDCGKESTTRGTNLKDGHAKSCGCLNTEKIRNNKRRWTGCGDIGGTHIARIKGVARKRGMEYNISKEYLWRLFLEQDKRCAITNIPLTQMEYIGQKNGYSAYKPATASLDRIDSSKGYIEGNVQWVHKKINELKWNHTMEELYDWCELVLKNRESCYYARKGGTDSH